MGLLKYSSNNSGGSWWLKDADWAKLEQAGWKVNWYKDQKDGFAVHGGRMLGALATDCEKEFATFADGIKEWESITGKDASDEGCNCCGAPHSFSFDNEYASGASVLQVLHPGAPTTLREAIERGNY